jgi:hypothetical protein
MSVENVTDNVYLVWLSLAACGLHQLTDVDLPNLRALDLSNNHLTTLHTDSALQLSNLVELDLRGNALTQIINSQSNLSHPCLQVLDVSFNALSSRSLPALSTFTSLSTLNISFNHITMLKNTAFSYLRNLSVLDMSGNHANVFALDVFKTLPELRSVAADDFRLCCPELFHASFLGSAACVAPRPVSCLPVQTCWGR